jgi:predicted acyl esterase
MTVISRFSNSVRRIEHFWITLKDGVRLSARMWLPEDAETNPVPAILEYIPYRKRDGTRGRDEPMHHYFAGHGYAAIRVDLRGSGESDGLLDDEYSRQELADGSEVIAWIAAQKWCNGAVGMMGKLGRLQLPAGRDAEAAGTESGALGLLDGRSLCR